MRFFYCLSIVLLYSLLLNAQNKNKCGINLQYEKIIKQNHEVILERDKFFNDVGDYISSQAKMASVTSIRTLPVVFHVIHYDGSENISKSQIEDQIRILNEDFRRLNSDTVNMNPVFSSVAADTKIEFKLATIDPNGDCTDGIVRVKSYLTHEADDNVKVLSWWDNTKYLNVWVVSSIYSGSSGTILGYAYYPEVTNWGSAFDGVLVRADYVGSIGTAVSSGSKGRTLTHEIGHYMGLPHTFDTGCSNQGDGITDTPPVKDANYSCIDINSCTNDNPDLYDMIENYMDYTGDNCMNTFTKGQKAVFDATFSQYRSSLVTPSNLLATGVDSSIAPQECTPEPYFIADNERVCLGSSITFTDESWNGSPTSWLWEFSGGNPSTSTDSNPTVTYNSVGKYDVSLTVSNSAGSNIETFTDVIFVDSTPGKYKLGYLEEFDNSSSLDEEWQVINYDDGYTWELTTAASFSGSRSIKMDNYSNNPGQVDELITPSFNLSAIQSPKFSFMLAYAQTGNQESDKLTVYISKDCGASWSLRFTRSGSTLATTSTHNSLFYPTSEDEWEEVAVNIPSSYLVDHVIFKFIFTGDGGNNLFIDDVSLSGTAGIEDNVNKMLSDFNIRPNPATDIINIDFFSDAYSNGKVMLYDLFGREISSFPIKIISGSNNIKCNVLDHNINEGVYCLSIAFDGYTIMKQLVIVSD